MLLETTPMKLAEETDLQMNGPRSAIRTASLQISDTFETSVLNERHYRDTLGKFATGVTVVTADTIDGPVGMTANSFASVSLNPALVLWSVAKKSGRYEVYKNARHFAIHVMRDDQRDLALDFARNARAFETCGWESGDHRVPLLQDCLARFECFQEAAHEGGDHTIIIGKVLRFVQGKGQPLIFTNGEFGKFVSGK